MASSTLATVITMPYNLAHDYWYGAKKQPELEFSVDEWVHLKTDEELAQEERQKIIRVCDQTFSSYSEERTYTPEELKTFWSVKVGSYYVPFERFGLTNPYNRRMKGVKEGGLYDLKMTDSIITRFLGQNEWSPKVNLQRDVEKGSYKALQVAAAVFQLGDDSLPIPMHPHNIQELMEYDGKIDVTPVECGTIQFHDRHDGDVHFTVEGDKVLVTDLDGGLIVGYNVRRSVTVQIPDADKAVVCKVETVYEKISEA